MSYSISARGATVALALAALATKFDEDVVRSQPTHAKDRDQALGVAKAFTDLLGPQPKDHEVTLSLNGSLSWDGDPNEGRFRWANVSFGGGYSYLKPVSE